MAGIPAKFIKWIDSKLRSLHRKIFLFALTVTALGAIGCTTNETENLTQHPKQITQYAIENIQENTQEYTMINIKNW